MDVELAQRPKNGPLRASSTASRPCPLSRMCEFMACFAKRTQATPHLAVGKENGAHIAMSALGFALRIRILMSAQRNTIVVGSAVSRYSRFLAGLPERGDAQGTCAVSRSTEPTGTVIDVQGGGSILKRNVLARGDGTGRASPAGLPNAPSRCVLRQSPNAIGTGSIWRPSTTPRRHRVDEARDDEATNRNGRRRSTTHTDGCPRAGKAGKAAIALMKIRVYLLAHDLSLIYSRNAGVSIVERGTIPRPRGFVSTM